jgi:hypothetical protein
MRCFQHLKASTRLYHNSSGSQIISAQSWPELTLRGADSGFFSIFTFSRGFGLTFSSFGGA